MNSRSEIAAWTIWAVAWALSFTAQMQLAFTSWEVWAWPATTDLAGLVGMLIALDQARQNRSTVVAWLIAVTAAAVMVTAKVGAAVGDPVSMLMHAWPPSIALACWYLLVHVRRAPREDMEPDIATDMSEPVSTATNGRHPRKPRPNRDRVASMLARHGADLTADMVALRLGVSTRHASRLLAEARRPTVVTRELEPG